jgi:signal transduction histidine kinase
MRNMEQSSAIHWFSSTARWLALVSLGASYILRGSMPSGVAYVFVGAAVWNVFLTFSNLLDWPIPGIRLLSLGADYILAVLLFYFGGKLLGPLGWAGILPIVTTALYFERKRWIVLVAAACALSFGLLSVANIGWEEVAFYIGASLALYIGVGLLVQSLVSQMTIQVQETQAERQRLARQAERVELERRQALYKLVSTLSATLNYQRVLDAALDFSMTALAVPNAPAEQLVCAVLLYNQDKTEEPLLQVASARRFTQADARLEIPGTSGLLALVIEEGEPQLTKNVGKDPELGRFISLRACQSAYAIPLRSGLETYGVLLYAHPENDYFTQERIEMLSVIGNQAMVALQNARLYRDLELEKERMIEVQEESRKKLARDLHDGPTQSVAALAMRVNFARRLMERDGKSAAEELYKIEELARRTTKEIRHMLFTLRPLVLESQGLIPALESMAEKMKETFNQNVIIEADPNVINRLEMSRQGVMFFIADEAISNARKHAQAAHIWVRLKPLESDVALLEVEDDGIGFDVNNIDTDYESRGSLGMINMRERAELVNGLLTRESAKGRGTRIRLFIPLTEEAADRLRRGG